MQRARRSSGRALRTGTARVLWPEPSHSGAHSRARYLPPVFLAMKVNAWTLEAFPSYGPEFHLGEWSLVTVRLRRNADHGACSVNPASAGCSAALRPAGDRPLRAMGCGRCRDEERFRKLRHACGASNREQMILTSRIIGTTLTLLVFGSNADTQRPVMCCREVDMNPPMQTAAAIAEVDVRASA
jgi:hypothetical protein